MILDRAALIICRKTGDSEYISGTLESEKNKTNDGKGLVLLMILKSTS